MPLPAAPSSLVRLAPAGVLALTVAVFAAVVATVTWQLRAGLREQIFQREARTLAAVASMQLDNRAGELTGVRLEDAPGALLVAVLKTSQLRGVSGVRIFDGQGRLSDAWPFRWTETPPPAALWAQLARGEASGRWHEDESGESLLGLAEPAPGTAALEAWVPLRRNEGGGLLGVAQFVVEGGQLAADLEAHDVRLWTQAMLAWAVGSAVIVFAVGSTLRRLAAANRALQAQSEDLLRANRELVLAAKTSALGTVTAHLMHELKNPLAGLEILVAGQGGDGTGRSETGGELAAASALTRRLRTMVNDVVGVLRDEQGGAAFELTAAEVAEIAAAKVRGEAAQRGVRFTASAPEGLLVSGRRGNLATLVLRNLLQNALEATPAGGAVVLTAGPSAAGGIAFEVSDTGTGLPEVVRNRLFEPCTSTKAGGTGVGLALSFQLAQQAGGTLELVRSDAGGTSFRLVLAPEA